MEVYEITTLYKSATCNIFSKHFMNVLRYNSKYSKVSSVQLDASHRVNTVVTKCRTLSAPQKLPLYLPETYTISFIFDARVFNTWENPTEMISSQ